MSSWIWMKGVDKPLVLDEEPIPPIHPGDDRPAIKDLIISNKKHIDKLALGLQDDPLFDHENKHDDLWLLRFVLSHKRRHKQALQAAKHTLKFRKERGLDDHDIRYQTPGTPKADFEEANAMMKYAQIDTFQWCIPHYQGNVFAFVRLKGYDQNSLVKNVPESYWEVTFTNISEWSFQWCDYITRTTGRLTKNVRLIDFDGMSFSDMNNENGRRDSNAMKVTEDVYPQLLQTILICHAPSWIQVVWRIFRTFAPKRLTEKVDFLHPKTNQIECNRLLKFISKELLPVRFGGEYIPWPVEYKLPGEEIMITTTSS